MSAPRTKRQFAGAASDPNQRQITSFFERKTTSPTDSGPATDYTSGPLSPPLPGAVQANLISVGMRVRKSVPEGYKTGHKFGGFQIWGDSTAPSSPSQPATAFQHPRSAAPAPSPRELLPFCGINKVGGLAVQPEAAPPIPTSFFSPSALDEPPTISISRAVPELDDVPGLTSSQDSVTSTTSPSSSLPYYPLSCPSAFGGRTAFNSKKRLYTDDDTNPPPSLHIPVTTGAAATGDHPIIWRERRDWVDGQVSPRSLAPVGWEKNARVMAVPRGVRKTVPPAGETVGGDAAAAARLRDLDQENRVAVAGDGGDFGEAEFLDYMELEEDQ